eukprot:206453_1
MDHAYSETIENVLDHFKTDPATGRSVTDIPALQRRYGKNELPAPQGTSFFRLVLKQFEDLLVLILLGAAVISFVLGFLEENESFLAAFVEPGVILLILIANAIVGVVQESNAEAAIEKLKEYEARSASVVRDGRNRKIDSVDLVPGDVVRVAVGEKVPADCRLVRLVSSTLAVDESMLTGEPIAVMKQLEPIVKENVVNQDKKNMLFSGTLVVRGRGLAMVVQTGPETQLGRIQKDLNEDEEVSKTPLQQKLDIFAEQLSKVILVICILVWLINIGHFTDPEHGSLLKGAIYYFKIAVALAVAAIPEGLPAVVTTCLALGTRKMAKKHAIVRSLPSVETLGCTTVICSDKTGTLTTNKMSVRKVMVLDQFEGEYAHVRHFDVKGLDFSPFGTITTEDDVLESAAPHSSLCLIGRISALCNETHISHKMKDGLDTFVLSGEATEGALRVLAEKIGLPDASLARESFGNRDPDYRVDAASKYWEETFPRVSMQEFTRDRKSMSVLSRDVHTDRQVLHVKGAPESILDRCTTCVANDGTIAPLSAGIRFRIEEIMHEYSSQGLRVLGLAYSDNPDPNLRYNDQDNFAQIESNMTFVGLTGMLDPPREEVRLSIEKCRRAGIRVIVITGDNKATAEAICRDIGIFGKGEVLDGKSFDGSLFMRLSDSEQNHLIRTVSLFSRVEPSHKLHLVDLLMKQDEVVAMTGDGVNDAPALHKADIGVAMGSGTAVAQEASDMVLQDDNFATIVMAVEEGRSIYANTKQFIRYLISSNIGEVFCIFLTAAIGMPEALIPVQLLWVNLVTDGLPATALGFNRPDADIMEQEPRGRSERIIDGWMFFRYFAIGLYIGVGTVFAFMWWFMMYSEGPQISYSQLTNFHACGTSDIYPESFDCGVFHDVARPSTLSLSVLVTIEMFNTFNALSENQSLMVTPPWDNIWVVLAVILSMGLHCVILYFPMMNDVFSTAPLNYAEWQAVILISFPVILMDELFKFITRTYNNANRVTRFKKLN